MPLFLWLPYIIFSGMFAAPKAEVPVQLPTRD
jgi:hypothetical protein